jgi:outer membrane lipoprotein-sorting protein
MFSKGCLLTSVLVSLCMPGAVLAVDAKAAAATAPANQPAPAGKAAVALKPAPAGKAAVALKPAPADVTAAQIVERNVAARGGLQAWRGLQALSVSGKMDAGTGDSIGRSIKVSRSRRAPTPNKLGVVDDAAPADKGEAEKQVQLPFVMEMKRPGKSRVEVEFAGKTAVQVYDGSQGWKLRPFLNRNDVESFTAEEAKAQQDKGDMEGPLVDYAAKGTKVQLEGVEAVEGHDAYKLKLTLKSGRVQHVWIDTQSFLDVKIDGIPRRMDGKMRTVWIYQRDFRKVDGLMMPFVLETSVDGYPDRHKMLIEKVAVNPKLDDSRFTKPSA